MELKLDLDFCNLFYSDEDKSIDKEKDLVIRAYNINKSFAKIEIPKFDIKLDYMGINGLIYGKEIPDYINNFNWFNIRILYKNISNTDEFLEEYKFFNENVLNIISHLESLGKVFFKINTEYDREYLNERNKDENFTYKNIHINLQSNIKVFPN
jgi:hypothetical protein